MVLQELNRPRQPRQAQTTDPLSERELEVHIGSALNVGASRDEVVEVIMQMALYAGFPAALDALYIAKRVFTARGLMPDAKT